MSSHFEKITSVELSECAEYAAREELKSLESDQEWDDHWDEFDRDLEDLNEALNAEYEDHLAACEQGHDWNDYDDPVNLYGEDGYYGFDG